MSNVPVPASNSSLPNAVKWNDPLPSFVPAHLKPAKWCGRQWEKITTLDGKNACSKMCQVILRIIPAIFLSLATVFAGVVGLIGSCCSSKPVEYSIVNMKEAIEAEMPQLMDTLLASVDERKVVEIINGLEIPEAFLKELNQAAAEAQEPAMTALQLKETIKQMAMPAVAKGLQEMRKELRKLPKDVTPTGEPKEEENAKAASVVVFGQPKGRFSTKEDIAEIAVASQVKVNAFQRVAHAFSPTKGAPAVSEVVKAMFLDGLKNIQAEEVMKQLPSDALQALQSLPPVVSSLLMKVIPDYVCKVVLPAIVSEIEPAILDSSAKAKVAEWAKDVNSVKFQISETKAKGDQGEVVPVFKVIVA